MEIGDWVEIPSGMYRGYRAKIQSKDNGYVRLVYCDNGIYHGGYYLIDHVRPMRQALPSYIGLFEDV